MPGDIVAAPAPKAEGREGLCSPAPPACSPSAQALPTDRQPLRPSLFLPGPNHGGQLTSLTTTALRRTPWGPISPEQSLGPKGLGKGWATGAKRWGSWGSRSPTGPSPQCT